MANAITNPLYGLTVGSVAFGELARFSASVLGSGVTITRFVPGQSGEMWMSGSSEYIYSDQMNQGSFGLSGSYGLSGAAKISGKLSGYYGHTVANSGKTLSIMLNAIDWAGVEYIDFNQLNAEDLMSALSLGPRQRLSNALDKFSAMQKAVGGTTDPRTLVFLPAIEMTLRGILLAGKWRDEATLKTMSDDACRKALIEKLREHSCDEEKRKRENFNWDQCDNDVLIGSGALVVFLLQAGIRDVAGLKTDTDDGHRNILIYCLRQIPGVQGMSNQKLVQLGLVSSLNVKPAVKEWVVAVEDFFTNCGTGLVVGVLWGGWGAAKLEFRTTGEENRWKYGGSGNFSYAGIGATLSISAAYGGSKSTIGQNASAKVDAFYNGACVKEKIENWAKELNSLATTGLSELGNKDVTRNAALAAPIEAPSIPDFAKPQKDPKVTDLFKEIKSLDGLKAYAQAAAWEKNKKAGNTENLQDFLKKTDDKNDVSGVPKDDTASPLIPPKDDAEDDSEDDSSVRHLRAGPPLAEPPRAADVSKYEPLGVWIVDWARLFPWLVTGHDNAVTKGVKALDWIRLKTLHQDCLSLTRLYDRLEGEGCTILVDGKAVDFHGIRDSFSHVAALVADFLSTRPAVTVVSDKIAFFIAQMSADARNIYATWDAVPQFRRCELGAGIIFQHRGEPQSSVSDLQIRDSRIEIRKEPCAFQEPDYSVFARLGKAWPFIVPKGKILAFVSVGSASTSGILSLRHEPAQYMSSLPFLTKQAIYKPPRGDGLPEDDAALSFGWGQQFIGLDRKVRILPTPYWDGASFGGEQGYRYYYLYPIPFDAAVGISDWKGCAMTTGMGTLGKELRAIKDELSKLNRYTFDSDLWDGVREVKDLIYSMEMLKPSYIGLTEAPPNIMPGR